MTLMMMIHQFAADTCSRAHPELLVTKKGQESWLLPQLKLFGRCRYPHSDSLQPEDLLIGRHLMAPPGAFRGTSGKELVRKIDQQYVPDCVWMVAPQTFLSAPGWI